MRICIIGNDRITLCREPPAAVNEGEIVVASNEELHAARLINRARILPAAHLFLVGRESGMAFP